MSNAFSDKNQTYGNSSSFNQVTGNPVIQAPIGNAATTANAQFTGAAPESYAVSQGRNLAGQTLRGDFLSPQSNPFLAQVGQQIGDQVFNQTQQRFAGAGRNVGGADAAGEFRSDLTNQLSPLYSDAYNRERGNQVNTMFASSQFDPLNQFIQRIGPLANASQDRTINTQQSGTNVSRDRASPVDTFLSIFG
jgi:hypothetical protein